LWLIGEWPAGGRAPSYTRFEGRSIRLLPTDIRPTERLTVETIIFCSGNKFCVAHRSLITNRYSYWNSQISQWDNDFADNCWTRNLARALARYRKFVGPLHNVRFVDNTV
jgi:hypothetical protein